MPLINHSQAIDDVFSFLSETRSKKWIGLDQAIRGVLKRNPYHPRDEIEDCLMWAEQSAINFPLMYLSNIYLFLFAKEFGYTNFLFATRDCCHMVRLFKKMFPGTNAHYFHCSRNMFEGAVRDNNLHFKDYVNSLIHGDVSKTIFVDIHGTGRRCYEYFESAFGEVPQVFLISTGRDNFSVFPRICQKYAIEGKLLSLVFGTRGGPIESLNYDRVGTLSTYNRNGPVREPLEYSLETIAPYHKCIDFIVDHLVAMDEKALIKKYNLPELCDLIRKIFNIIVDDQPVISEKFSHVGHHKIKIIN